MTDLEMPANLTGPPADWLHELPELVAGLCERWEVEAGRPYQPGGSASWVAPTTDGRVLKVGWQHYEARDEAAGLLAWDGQGTVRVYRAERFGRTDALLLEACRPGTTLTESAPPAERDEVIAQLLPRLWITPPPGSDFRPLQSMTDAWGRSVDPDQLPDPDPGLARAGLELWWGLAATADREVLLCTDLHPGNVLRAEREPWLIVDPKPYVGDPAYDPIQHMLNFPDRLAADPGAFADRMAGLLGLDAVRVRQWLFARCVMEPGMWDVATRLAP
ncbi:aminoglycoside phosphotransferase family protein [Actinoplanes sp. TRM 88003]|uniref:Aminoglycoside phosphotransferase family protein n=1 Tax=Paractinoplanes aksuensis TaxID=2939490 RepID=A0ABT1DEE2_9ACTN|nr:aminoglycoside phosphotransferase family protein [Actinoplanes aksuensis]MCO8269160.1 aminoglycoside phosphotransferase family protein [Actinoplanes aksuensis]